jgi:hypothetical protein
MSTKSFLNLTFLFLGIFSMLACNNQANQTEASSATNDSNQTEISQEWDQLMERYHNAMAGTFHPAEDGDLDPVRSMYEELSRSAEAWAAAPIPEKHAGKNFDESLATLVKEAQGIGEMVQNQAADEELTKALNSLHDTFHAIKGQCEDGHN